MSIEIAILDYILTDDILSFLYLYWNAQQTFALQWYVDNDVT